MDLHINYKETLAVVMAAERWGPFEEAHSSPNTKLAYKTFKMLYSEVVDKHASLQT